VEEILTRAWDQLLGRLFGPLSFRFMLQPAVAAVLAVRVGLADARAGRPPYLRALLVSGPTRSELLRHAWRDVGKVFIVAVVIDAIYQIGVLRFFYPLQAIIVAAVLAFVPYVVVRGLAMRAARAYTRIRLSP